MRYVLAHAQFDTYFPSYIDDNIWQHTGVGGGGIGGGDIAHRARDSHLKRIKTSLWKFDAVLNNPRRLLIHLCVHICMTVVMVVGLTTVWYNVRASAEIHQMCKQQLITKMFGMPGESARTPGISISSVESWEEVLEWVRGT
jgi:hypothetical protein